MKTLTKKQQNQRQNSKQKQKLKLEQPKIKASATSAVAHEDAAEQLSGYDSYYKQLSEEVEMIERHVRELRQTLGLEHLTETEAQAQVDFMLRFSAWIFNQHLLERLTVTTADIDEPDAMTVDSANVAKVQKRSAQSNKKVTEFLSL